MSFVTSFRRAIRTRWSRTRCLLRSSRRAAARKAVDGTIYKAALKSFRAALKAHQARQAALSDSQAPCAGPPCPAYAVPIAGRPSDTSRDAPLPACALWPERPEPPFGSPTPLPPSDADFGSRNPYGSPYPPPCAPAKSCGSRGAALGACVRERTPSDVGFGSPYPACENGGAVRGFACGSRGGGFGLWPKEPAVTAPATAVVMKGLVLQGPCEFHSPAGIFKTSDGGRMQIDEVRFPRA
jgi:hypothetical protein